jgi:hypothetical protein
VAARENKAELNEIVDTYKRVLSGTYNIGEELAKQSKKPEE